MSALIKESPTLNAQFGKAPTPEDLLSMIRSFGGTFTRSGETIGDPTPETLSASTYTDNLGVLRQPEVGYPRPNFVAGVNKGILIEEQRTNLTLHSEAFDNAYWVKVRVTVSENNTIAPSGLLTADKIIPNTESSTHAITRSVGTVSNTETLSLYAKASEYNFVVLELGTIKVWFNILTGVIGTIEEGLTAKIEETTDGFYRCSVSGVRNNVNNAIYVSNADNVVSFAGDGTSGIFIWGAQLEAGSFPTSYIPTAGEAVTRGAETFVDTDISKKWSTVSNTLFGKISVSKIIGGTINRPIVTFSDNTGNNRIIVFLIGSTPEQLRFLIQKGGVTQAQISKTISDLRDYSFACRIEENNVAFAVDGELVGTDTTAEIPVVNRYNVGAFQSGTLRYNDSITTLNNVPIALPNAQLQLLSRL